MSTRLFSLNRLVAVSLIATFGLGMGIVVAADAPIPTKMTPLPAEGFVAVQKNGQFYLMSTNGHYVIKGGTLIDAWNKQELRNISEVEKSERLPLRKMGIIDRLQAVSLDHAKTGKDVVVFIDPNVQEVQGALEQIRHLIGKYDFHFVILNSAGGTEEKARAFLCSPEQAKKFFAQGGPRPTSVSGDCGEQSLVNNQVVAKILLINQIPTTVAPNGVVLRGINDRFAAFLSQNVE